MRWLPVAAWCCTLIGLVLAFVTLLAGITGNHANPAYIALFNTSSLGLADYHDPASTLYANISALVPPDSNNPPSITQYLGVKDWYRMYYFEICSGFWAPSTSNPSLLTDNNINITCTRQVSGYVFSLSSILAMELKPGAQKLAAEVAANFKDQNTGPWSGLWYTGISNGFLALVALPYIFSGRRGAWFRNHFIFNMLVISLTMFIASSGLATSDILGITRSTYFHNSYPSTFIALTWLTSIYMVLAFCLVLFEWKFLDWTETGEPITVYWKRCHPS
jgi:hypothetical protein